MTDSNNRLDDPELQEVLDSLAEYQDSHPNAQIDVRRQNSVSVRVRIIDEDFEGMDRVDREPTVWKLLKTLPEDVFSNITMLLLLTPDEAPRSMANREFNDPIPSRL